VVVSQGDLFWVDLGEPAGSQPGFRRPFVVVQNDLFNRSRLSTVIVCALTSNLRRAEAPGNVLLPKGAGNLPKDSVANVTQLFTVDKGELADRIGRLGRDLVADILCGNDLVLDPRRTLDGGTAAT